MYIILGCDDIGCALARNLNKTGEDVVVVDNDEAVMAGLKELNLHTILADINTFDFSLLPVKDIIAFIILKKNSQEIMALVQRIKKIIPNTFILSRVVSEREALVLQKNGVDCTVQTNKIITNAILTDLETAKLKRSAFHLVNVIKAAYHKGLAIFLQDNPDPDALASGLALKRIADDCGIKSRIYYGGHIGHQQNKRLVDLLKIELVQLKNTEESRKVLATVDKVALIEASIPSKNNILHPSVIPNIIIDHHQTDFNLVKGEFIEIMPKIGAASTIMTRYLRYLNIIPSPPLATALRYGIRVDTGGFTRNTTPEDIDAAAYLSPLVDAQLLNQIENPPMSMETLDIIGRAICNREVKGSYLVSFVEFINDRDALPQAAELALHTEGISTVLVFGIDKDKVHLSARSTDSSINLALLLEKAFGFMNAGGHAMMAAGSISLGVLGNTNDKKSLLKSASNLVRKKFFTAAGLDMEEHEMHKELELLTNK